MTAAILDWAAGPGFEAVIYERGDGQFPWRSAHEFRQRHLIQIARSSIF